MTRKHKNARKTQDEPSPLAARRLAAAKEALTRIRRGEAPSAEELAAAPLLQFWCIVLDEPLAVLQGVVTGHPLIPDGHMIGTSPLIWLARDQSAARTLSRWYRLGVPLTGAVPKLH